MRFSSLAVLLVLAAAPSTGAAQAIPVPLTAPASEDGWLGVVLDDDTGEVIARQVLPQSPAHSSGVSRGDVIVAIDGVRVETSAAFITLVRDVGPENVAILTLRRAGGEEEVSVTLGNRPPNLELAQALVGTQFPWLPADDVRTGERVLAPADRDVWTVIEFWATWCGPCHLAAPRMVELHGTWQVHGVEFVGVALDSEEELRTFLDGSAFVWPQIADPEGARNNEALVIAQPTWFLLAPGGEIRGAFIGLGGLDLLEQALGELDAYSASSPK